MPQVVSHCFRSALTDVVRISQDAFLTVYMKEIQTRIRTLQRHNVLNYDAFERRMNRTSGAALASGGADSL